MLLLLISLLATSQAIIFWSPPPMAIGPIHGALFHQLLPNVDVSIYNTNVTIQIAADYLGCDPSLQNWKGKVAWFASGSCASYGLSQPLVTQWAAFQSAGAIGIVETILGTSADQSTGQLFGGVNAPASPIPVIGILHRYNFYYSTNDPSNPPVGLTIFGLAPTTNVTAFFEYPQPNALQWQMVNAPSVYGFVVYSSNAFLFIALLLCTAKLTMFVNFQGLKPTIPIIVLSLCSFSSFICLFYTLWGPSFASRALQFGPGAFFQLHYFPYWYASVTIYAFYLVEVSQLTSNQLTGLDKFKIPAVIVCGGLYIIELIVASIFAAFPPTVSFPQIIQMVSITYLCCGALISTLLIFCTVMLTVSVLKSSMRPDLIIRFALTSFFFLVMFWLGNLWSIFVVSGQYSFNATVSAGNLGQWWSTAFVCAGMALTYRISLTKEIELSKTQNSSTSSTNSHTSVGSSKSSSSSMSSRQDPVIEL